MVGAMFGMGMGELLLILIVALLAVGPDKLPGAAKSIGKAIRDLRKQGKELQTTLEEDSKLGEAVRELRSALNDDPSRPRVQTRPVPPRAAAPGQPDPRTHTMTARPANVVAKQASGEAAPATTEPAPATAQPAEAAAKPDDPEHG